MMEKNATRTQIGSIESALHAALTPVQPPRAVLGRLQARIREMAPADRRLPTLAGESSRPNLTFLGMAGVFTLLMTLAVGFRTAGSIVSALTLANEVNRQLKSRKTEGLTPTG